MTADSPHDNRRRHPRVELTLPGTAFVLCDSNVLPVEVWTRNISAGGISLISHTELLGDRMILQLAGPQFAGKLIECHVRHRSRYDRLLIDGRDETMYVCGLEFGRVFEEGDVHETLRKAFALGVSLEDDEECCQEEDEESLMGLLSAIGIVVVYATRLPMM
jgi:hypothetical protein